MSSTSSFFYLFIFFPTLSSYFFLFFIFCLFLPWAIIVINSMMIQKEEKTKTIIFLRKYCLTKMDTSTFAPHRRFTTSHIKRNDKVIERRLIWTWKTQGRTQNNFIRGAMDENKLRIYRGSGAAPLKFFSGNEKTKQIHNYLIVFI